MAIGFAIACQRTPGCRRAPGTLRRALAVARSPALAGVLWKILLIENRSGIVNYYLDGRVGPLF